METDTQIGDPPVSVPTQIRRYVVTREDRSQVLIERYPDGRLVVAFRDTPWASWGIPHPAEEATWTV